MDYGNPSHNKMAKGLIVLCIAAAIQVCSAREVGVPAFKQPYGLVETRAINGTTATRGQFPYNAIVIDWGWSLCGGSLISKNWVLTSAKCIHGTSEPQGTWEIHLGASDYYDDNEPGRVRILSRKAIRHENYNPETNENDIGLIPLPTDVELSDTIKIIKLPPRSYQHQNFAGQTARSSGWGRPHEIACDEGFVRYQGFIDLTLITQEECQGILINDTIFSTQYCGKGANMEGLCKGDSGGPLTIGSGENLFLLGIGSFVSSLGCDLGYPSGFTALPFYVDWVSEKTGIPVSDF